MTDSPVDEVLGDIKGAVKSRFDRERRVLSFDQFLELVRDRPYQYTRDAARYLHDCLDHFGSYDIQRPWGPIRRFRVFDLDFAKGGRPEVHAGQPRRNDRLVGQEAIQLALYRQLTAFVREGRVNRLLMLHGPNGSAKSTFAACLMRGLEEYSFTDEGALYRFSWVFPHSRDGKALGFGAVAEGPKPGESYALLPEDRIQLKIPSETREHPLLLFPRDDRRRLLTALYAGRDIGEPPPDWLWNGELGQKNRQIFEALLNAYRGDLTRVLAHVQVERFTISRRYRQGAVTIGPQMAVDAAERQITADRSLSMLPASLASLTLYEVFGELVDAAGGIVEYSDLLKRPLDAWKYLLLAIENGEVSLHLTTLAINAVLLASSNELHLSAFKEHPDYHSFRGRLVLVRVPYLVDHTQEQGIYDAQIVPQIRSHVAPHTTFVAAYWAVLTRLRPPRKDHYDDSQLGRAAAQLRPDEKAALYAYGTVPSRLPDDDAKALRAGVREVYEEYGRASPYEGQTGASPREIRSVLFDVAAEPVDGCITPARVLDALAELCDREDYEFLRQKTDGGYYDHREFVESARSAWLDRVDSELRAASGLVEAARYEELFERYVAHVAHWMKQEKVYNPVTGKHENPDTDLMDRVERMLEVRIAVDFRREILATIASYAIDHPEAHVDYRGVFPRYFEQMEESYFGERRKQLRGVARDIISIIDGHDGVPEDRRAVALAALERLERDFGYIRASAHVALGELLTSRYVD